MRERREQVRGDVDLDQRGHHEHGTAIATVTTVAASSCSHSPLRLAMIQAASGRNSAISSGIACGSTPSSRSPGRDAQEVGDAGERVPDHVRLRAQREGGRAALRTRSRGARRARAPSARRRGVLRLQRQRAAGDEAGDAGHRVQREHEQVARAARAATSRGVADRERRLQRDRPAGSRGRARRPPSTASSSPSRPAPSRPASARGPPAACAARRAASRAYAARRGRTRRPKHPSARPSTAAPGYLKRSSGTSHIASAAIRQDILLCPARGRGRRSAPRPRESPPARRGR